jgi:hypothetical protein
MAADVLTDILAENLEQRAQAKEVKACPHVLAILS